MTLLNLQEQARQIADDKSLTIEDRIERLLSLRNVADDGPDNDNDNYDLKREKENADRDVIIFEALARMIESAPAESYDETTPLLAYTLLAEAYSDSSNPRPLKTATRNALDSFSTDEPTEYCNDIIDALHRLAAALKNTPFNHAYYDVLCAIVETALANGMNIADFKSQIVTILKLHVLMQEDGRNTPEWLNREVPKIFKPKELLDIILNPTIGHLRKDPVEYTWEWESVYYDVEDQLEKIFEDEPRHMGFCFRYWSTKKDLLKNAYGIDWKSPSMMNPRVMFD